MLLTIIKAARHSGITERAMRALIKEGKIPTRTVPKEEMPFVRGLPFLVTVIHEDDLKPYMGGSSVTQSRHDIKKPELDINQDQIEF